MINYYVLKKLATLALSNTFFRAVALGLFCISSSAYSQCTTGSEFGSVFTPNYSGDAEVISANTGNGFYTKINILPNRFYTFMVMIPSQLSAGYVDYTTIANEDGTVVFASGSGVVRWASNNNTGVIRYYNHTNSSCLAVPNNRTKLIMSSTSLCLPPSSSFSSSPLSSTSVSLSWSDLVPAPSDGYEYYVSSSSDYPANLASQTPTGVTTVPNVTISNLDNALGYSWWVRSHCGNTRSIWKKGGAFTICTEPPMVTITNLATFSAKLNWLVPDPIPEEGYQYAISTVNVLPTTLSTTTQNNVTFSGLLSGTLYYYWLRSNCDIDNKSAWVTGSFTTETVYCTNAPYGLRPQATYSPTCTGLWEEISSNSYFGEYCNVNIQPNTNYIFGIDYLEINDVYTPGYVTLTNEDGTINFAGGIGDTAWFSGNNSGVIRFYLHRNAFCNTIQIGIGKYIKCVGTLNTNEYLLNDPKLFPNPVSDYLNLSHSKIIDAIEITDILGQSLKRVEIQSKESSVDLSALSSGTYFVKIFAENVAKVYKIIKQ